jgi:pyruvate ferredoxin oxidoreductase gamma subunit
MIEIRWHGRGGQGAFTAAKILGASASLFEDEFALAFPSFGPERRGAPIQSFTKIDSKKIIDRSEIKKCDYIVLLDESLFDKSYLNDLKPQGKVIINSTHSEKYKGYSEDVVTFDATGIALNILKRATTNTAMIGALIGLSGILSIESVMSGSENYLKGLVLEKNREVIMASYNKVRGE